MLMAHAIVVQSCARVALERVFSNGFPVDLKLFRMPARLQYRRCAIFKMARLARYKKLYIIFILISTE
jgi:hypothetical protein